MTLQLHTNRDGNLVVHQGGFSVTRYAIGVPLLLFGLLLLYGVISSPILTLREHGSAGLANAIVGSLVLLLFTALALPLGWWICFSRHWLLLDSALNQAIKVSDWRLGRRQTPVVLQDFTSVRLAVEELNTSSQPKSSRKAVLVRMIRLLAKDPDETPSLEIGWLDLQDEETATQHAQEIARTLKLPLQILSGDEPALTPTEEQMAREDDLDDE